MSFVAFKELLFRHRADLRLLAEEGGEGRTGVLISTCKLFHRTDKQEVLLHSAGNYIQYPMIKHSGKEYFV